MLGHARPRDVLLGDRAYDSDALRQDLATRGARANVSLMPNRGTCRPSTNGLYRQRNSGRTLLQQIKHFRAVAPDTTKRDDIILLASSSPQSEFGSLYEVDGLEHLSMAGPIFDGRGAGIHLFNTALSARRWMGGS